MWQNQPWGPWGYPPPTNNTPIYIPVPNGTDTERVLKIVERMERKKDRRKKEEEAEKKRKDDAAKTQGSKWVMVLQHMAWLTFLGPFVGAAWFLLGYGVFKLVRTVVDAGVAN